MVDYQVREEAHELIVLRCPNNSVRFHRVAEVKLFEAHQIFRRRTNTLLGILSAKLRGSLLFFHSMGQT